MLSTLSAVVLLAACGDALPSFRTVTNALGRRDAPASPIGVASTQYLCNVHSTNTQTVRDLGYVGRLGGQVVHSYGDTLNAPSASFWMTSDSSALGTNDPCKIFDAALDGGVHPAQFVPIEEKWGEVNTADAMGITNIIETDNGAGVLFFLKNHRPIGGDKAIIGAGIADVTMDGNVPTATRTAEYWWDAQKGEPYYGDITAYGGEHRIWGLGHGGNGQYSYLTRALKDNVHDLSSWEYFDGSTGEWSSNRLYNPTPAQAAQWNEEEGPMWGVGQGQMIWSSYYNKIMFVYALNWKDPNGQTQILARTADRPRGPWSKATVLFAVSPLETDGLVYSPIPNPYFDDSGKTLIVTVTNNPNTLQATRVTFT